jgi:hypothetical protein
MKENNIKSEIIKNRESWLKIGITIFFSLVFGIPMFWKLMNNDLQFDLSNINFESLLTVIISFFAILLSVMFYFKATDSSNQFYNNSYKFTKDISESLRGIESGFGEKLKNIDKGYDDFRKSFETFVSPQDKAEIKKEVEEEKKNIKEIIQEKDKIIEEFKQKTNLSENELEKYFTKIKEKEKELNEKNLQINELKNNLKNGNNSQNVNSSILNSLKIYTKTKLDNTPENILASRSELRRYFKNKSSALPSGYLKEMERINFINDRNILTKRGIEFLRQVLE